MGFELRRRTPLHTGRIFDLVSERVRLPSGLEQELDVVVHGGAVAIAALREDGKLVCVRQYRHAVGQMLVEIPAGRLEAGEEPLTAARRELEEETGFRAASWRERLRLIPAPGFCSERIVLFEARDLEAVPGG
ncbi:MAG: NUDIX hydrolase, partial [Planctomycetota bacterium]